MCTSLGHTVFRFEKRIYIPLPEELARAEMFKLNVGDTPNTLVQDDYRALAKHAEGYAVSFAWAFSLLLNFNPVVCMQIVAGGMHAQFLEKSFAQGSGNSLSVEGRVLIIRFLFPFCCCS